MTELSPDELRKLAQKAIGEIHVSMGNDILDSDVKVHIPTGWSLLDLNMGGGLPVGRSIEIYGREATGKSALLYKTIANCQKMGGIAVLLDSEAVFPKDLAESAYGVDLQYLTLLPPELALEDVFITFLSLVRSFKETYPDRPVLIGWDTLAATPTKDEVEKGEEEQRGMMAQYRARTIRQGFRLLTYEIAKSNVCFVVINQGYERMNPSGIPSIETPGGLAMRYYASVRILLRAIGILKGADDGPPVGYKVSARFEKNKLSPPRREVESRFFYGQGFDDEFSILDYAVENGLIRKSGPWSTVSFEGKDIKFYDSKFKEILEKTPGLLDHLREQVSNHYKSSNLLPVR